MSFQKAATSILIGISLLQSNTSRAEVGASLPPGVRMEKCEPGRTGVRLITYHLDGQKLNRLNNLRKISKLREAPHLFGIDRAFPPLMTIECTGPGAIIVKTQPAGESQQRVEIPAGGRKVEFYPNYKASVLWNPKTISEKITVIWENQTDNGDIELVSVDQRELVWSQPNEIFLSRERMQDLTALAWRTSARWNTRESAIKTLKQIQRGGIIYEKPQPQGGWQKIRTLPEILVEKRANCLDLTVAIAGKSARTGWLSQINILDGHSIPSIGDEKNPLWLETTALLISESRPRPESIANAILLGEAGYRAGLEKTKQALTLDVKDWLEVYKLENND